MAVGVSPGELRELTDDELKARLRESKEELFNLRFQSATGQLESHGRLRAVKRDIARIYTVIRERELGIRATPVVSEAPAKKAAPKRTTKKSEADAPADAETSTDDSSTVEKNTEEEAK